MVNVESPYDLFVFELQGVRAIETELGEALETLSTRSGIDSLDDNPGDEFRKRAGDLFESHGDRTAERADRLDDAFDALDTAVTTSERTDPAVEALLEESERFNNVVLEDALRNPYYLDVAIKAEQLLVQAYGSALDVADHLDLDRQVVDTLDANREDAEGMLAEAEDLDGSSELDSLFHRLVEESPRS